MSGGPTFVYLLRPRRADFLATMTAAEEDVMGAHFAHLQAVLADGNLILAGPCEDAAFGIVVFRSDSPEEAARLMAADPAVRGGLMDAEIHPFRVSLRGT